MVYWIVFISLVLAYLLLMVLWLSAITPLSYVSHKSLTKDVYDEWEYGSFEEFKSNFDEVNWTLDDVDGYWLVNANYYDYDTIGYSLATNGVFVFDGRGMILESRVDYLKAFWYYKQYVKRRWGKLAKQK